MLFDMGMLRTTKTGVDGANEKARNWGPGLSSRLFALTIAFILIAEALILLPSIANFRDTWLNERVEMAQTAVLALEAAPERQVSDQLSRDLLERARIVAVAVSSDMGREIILSPAMEMYGEFELVDLRSEGFFQRYTETMNMLASNDIDFIRIIQEPRFEAEYVEVVVEALPLKMELKEFTLRVILLSLFISTFVGVLIYLSLVFLVVRPIRKITGAIESIRDAPRDFIDDIQPTGRSDEIGRAEDSLHDMQTTVRAALREREHLAQLGEAMAKINHDLRNSLAAAQIVSDGLNMSEDPRVQRAAPRLERALERAISLAEDTLKFGRSESPEPHIGEYILADIIAEAALEGLAAHPDVHFEHSVDDALRARIDADHLHRIIVNLVRNAAQALAARISQAKPGEIRISATMTASTICLNLSDNGPGIPKRMQETVFQPFTGSRKEGRSGLGLAIARELASGMQARLDLVSTGPDGTVFELTLRR